MVELRKLSLKLVNLDLNFAHIDNVEFLSVNECMQVIRVAGM